MPMDYTGKSDPYAVLKFGNDTFRTRYIKQDLNPVWNEVHNFDVETGKEQLKIDVYDKDEFGSDDHLGKAAIFSLFEFND